MRTHLAMLLTTLSLSTTALAGPTVIRDARVADKGVTPYPGRGYSLATNTFQSTCLQDLNLTTPTYDVEYNLHDVSSESNLREAFSVGGEVSASYFFVKAKVSAKRTTSNESSRQMRHIVAHLDVTSYYSSVDEGSSRLSDSAAALVAREDLYGFYSACGPTYVRSLTRKSEFVAVFSFEAESETEASEFAASLAVELKGFGGGGGFGASVEMSESFEHRASEQNLTISIRGFGLGKDKNANLIASDLETFRKAISSSFVAMQDEETGMVIGMEVIPWVENTHFQELLAIAEDDSDVPLYKKKAILQLNAEFMSRAERAARNKLNIFYTASLCRDEFERNWSASEADGAEWDAVKGLQLVNHRTGSLTGNPTAEELYANLSKGKRLEELRAEYMDYMYGDQGNGPSVTACISALLDNNRYFQERWDQVDECAKLEADFPAAQPQIYDDYCMPTLAEEVDGDEDA